MSKSNASDVELTAREAWLLSWCVRVPGRSMLRLNGLGYWTIVRTHAMYRHGSERVPSLPEGIRLVNKGLVTLRLDPANYTENTLTGQRWLGSRAVITAKGRAALDRYLREHP